MKRVAAVLATMFALAACEGSQMTTPSAPVGGPRLNMGAEASVTGSGHITATGADTEFRTFSFHAVRRADGSVTGRFQVQTRQNDPDDKILGDVVCVTVIGNKAWIVGYVTGSDNPTAPVGTYTRFRVADNGEGANSPPDQISLMEVGIVDPPPYCLTVPERPALVDIEAGNIQVR